jgi:hypothetical protein
VEGPLYILPLFSLRFVIPHSVIPTTVEGPLFSFCHFERDARFNTDAAIAKLFSSEIQLLVISSWVLRS